MDFLGLLDFLCHSSVLCHIRSRPSDNHIYISEVHSLEISHKRVGVGILIVKSSLNDLIVTMLAPNVGSVGSSPE